MKPASILAILLLAAPAFADPPIVAAALTPDAKRIVLGSQAGIEVRSWPDLKPHARWKTDLNHVHDLAFAPDGRTLLAAGGSPAAEGAVEVWSWPEGQRIRRVAGHADLVYRVAWSPDGTRWVSGSADGICRVFASASGQALAKYEGHSRTVVAIAFLPDGETIVSAGVDRTLQVWRADTAKTVRTLDNHVDTVNDLAVRPATEAGRPTVVASVGEDRTVRLWQPTIGRLMRFARLESPPRVVAWSPSGDRLLVGCNDGRLRVLDPDTLETVAEQRALDGRIHTLVPGPTGDRTIFVGGAEFRVLAW